MKNLFLSIATVLVAGCSAEGYGSPIVATTVLAGVAPTGTTGGACKIDASQVETDFLRLGPDNVGHVGVVLSNQLQSNATLNSLYRINTNDFEAQTAQVDFEMLSNAGNLPSVTRPASGLVPSGKQAPVGVLLFDQGQLAGAGLPDGAFFRATIQIEGKLLDSSTVKSTKRVYLFQYCAAAGCAGNTCL